jgi:hypothetical protein
MLNQLEYQDQLKLVETESAHLLSACSRQSGTHETAHAVCESIQPKNQKNNQKIFCTFESKKIEKKNATRVSFS